MAFNVLKEVQEFYTDFIGGSLAIACEPFLNVNTGTGAASTLQNSVDPYWGIVQLGGNTAAGSSQLIIDPSMFLLNKRPFRAHVQFQIPTLPVFGAADFIVTMGFSNEGTAGSASITNGARMRIQSSAGNTTGAVITETFQGSGTANGGPNTEFPVGTTLTAGQWYNYYIQVDFLNSQSQLTYGNLIAGPTVGVRQWLIPDLGLSPSFPGVNQFNAFTQGYLGEYPVSFLPTANTGFVIGTTWVGGAARFIQVNRAYILADRWNPGN